jgi:hypothetical protein
VSDFDKMVAFGHWLEMKRVQMHNELFATAVSKLHPEAAIRVKAGHVEAFTQVLEVFKELYHGDLNKFMVERLGQAPEEEEDSDVSHA